MNKEELVSAIAEKSGFSKTDVKKFIDHFVNVTTESLSLGKAVQLIGYLTMSVTERSARVVRNPRTGEDINVPARKMVKCAVGKRLKEAVNA